MLIHDHKNNLFHIGDAKCTFVLSSHDETKNKKVVSVIFVCLSQEILQKKKNSFTSEVKDVTISM